MTGTAATTRFVPTITTTSGFKLKGKGRSEQWEVYLYGDKTINVGRGSAEVLPRGVPGIGGVDFGSSPNLATDHTIYELCLPSECVTRILRV